MPLAACEPLSRIERARILIAEICRHAWGVATQRRRRTADVVRAEYNDGSWRAVLAAERWRGHESLIGFLADVEPGCRIAKIEGAYVRIDNAEYYRYRGKVLAAVLAPHAPDDELVELGCGWGMNLFSLCVHGGWRQLFGLDISPNAVRVGTEVAGFFGLSDVHFNLLDLTDTSHPGFSVLRGRTVFTYYCLEQLKYSTASIVDSILRAGPRRVIHIEPTTEVLRWWSLADTVSYLYIMRQDYQDNLIRTLERFEARGLVKIIQVERLGYSPTVKHDPALVCWEPRV